MSEELLDILANILPSRKDAEDAAELIQNNRGQAYLSDLVRDLTDHECAPEETEALWQGIVNHNQEMTRLLGRNPGLRVAAMDYFGNVLARDTSGRGAHVELIEHLFHQATNDALTGLTNRRYFKARLADELSRAHRYHSTFAQFLFDIDDFKAVNDTKGHATGDQVLCDIADAIRACLRESDVPARWGGEEFAILMPETTPEGAAVVAERIRAYVEEHLALEKVTVSGGLACFPKDGTDERSLFAHADRALYRAKAEGKNQICLAPEERRREPRIERALPFTLLPSGSSRGAIESETANVSSGGLGFQHPRLLWVSDEVKGVVRIDDEPADFRGRIAHIVKSDDGAYEIGVAFTDISERDRARLMGSS